MSVKQRGLQHGISPFDLSIYKSLCQHTVGISCRHNGLVNIAFVDGRVESGTLRNWTLYDSDNWFPLYGTDEVDS